MNDTVIDFVQLRKMEKLRAKKERLLAKQKQQMVEQNMEYEKEKTVPPVVKTEMKVKQEKPNNNNVKELDTEGRTCVSYIDEERQKLSLLPCSTLDFSETTMNTIDIGKYEVHVKNQNIEHSLKHVYYIPQCLTEEYIQSLSQWLHSLPKVSYDQYKSNQKDHQTETMDEYFNGKWTRLKHAQRNVVLLDLRLLSSQGKTTVENKTNVNTILIERLCHLLTYGIKAFPESHPPNHILINEYEPMEGIMPHTDGPLYFHKTATFSIGGDVLFQFTKRQNDEHDKEKVHYADGNNDHDSIVMQIMLSGKGSLIVFDDDAYINHCHSINDRILNDMVEYAGPKCVNLEQGDIVKRGHRFSLTFRHKY